MDVNDSTLNIALHLRDMIHVNNKNGVVTMPFLDALKVVNTLCDTLLNDYHLSLNKHADGPYNAFKCSSCDVYDLAEDERIAEATIDRLIRSANGNGSVVTKDEAMNLLHFFEMHRRFIVKDGAK